MTAERIDHKTSASLLLRIRNAKDVDAWHMFVSIYQPLVERYAIRRGLQHADAADVSQLVLSKVSQAIRGFDYAPERGRFRGWLGTITANEVKTFQARQGRRGPVMEEADSTPQDPDPLWNAEFVDHLLAVALDRIRSEFTPVTWAAFEAAWVRQEAPVAIAANLGIALHTVYVNKSRVLQRLEKEVLLLAEDFPFSDTNSRQGHDERD